MIRALACPNKPLPLRQPEQSRPSAPTRGTLAPSAKLTPSQPASHVSPSARPPARGFPLFSRLAPSKPADAALPKPLEALGFAVARPDTLAEPRRTDPAMPETERWPRGQPIACKIEDREVRGELRGSDYKGRPVLLDRDGERRICDWPTTRALGRERHGLSPLAGLRPTAIVRPPEKLTNALDAALDIEVTGPHTAREYVDALHGGGYATYLVGGAIRDAVHVFATEPEATNERILETLKDIDIVTTAPPNVVRRIAAQIAPEYPEGAVWSSPKVDQFGSVLVGGPKAQLHNPEGIDINTLRSEGAFEEERYHPDTKETAFPYTFDHSLQDDAATRDFTCNAIYFDLWNRVLIDPWQTGLEDAIAKRLRVARWSTLEKDDNIALRYYKFRMRGFEGEPKTRERIHEQAAERLWSIPRWRVANNVARIAPKDARTPEEVHAFLDKLRDTMTGDGAGRLYQRRIAPLESDIVNRVERRFKKPAAPEAATNGQATAQT